jgi:SAM-dependent methyltransferase
VDGTSAKFDKYADNYSESLKNDLRKFGKHVGSAKIYKAQLLKHILNGEPGSILDFGCEVGLNIPYLREQFKNTKLYGCDVSPASVEIAKKNYPYCDFNVINNAADLQEYKDVDCVFISTVLHHIPESEHKNWINGLHTILSRNGGTLVVFEHNMKNPLTRSIVKGADADDITMMLDPKYCKRLLLNTFYGTKAGGRGITLVKDAVKSRYTYFFPQRNKLFTMIESMLTWLPLGAQYCVYARKQ